MFWNIIIGLALMVIGYLLMPKPKKAKPPEVTEMEGPTAEAGRPIPVVFGDYTISSPNFLWWGDKVYVNRSEPAGGKKKK